MTALTAAEQSEYTEELQQWLHDMYKHLHRTPELSMQEVKTSAFVHAQLEELGFEVFYCAWTGVVGVLRNGAGPVVGFRADLDGLPVLEDTDLEYASTAHAAAPDGGQVPLMHACGHDVHITCALGAARVLSETRDDWSGTVVLLFQPGEETGQGARAMIEDGLWERTPHPEVIFAQHVWPMHAGTLKVASGPAMALSDSWRVTVHGRGGHASRPDETIDPVVLAAHMIVRTQSVVSREVHPLAPAVVTIATIQAGTKENIIAGSAEFTVNVRSLDQDVRARLLAALRRVYAAEAMASGAPEPKIDVTYEFPLLYNDPQSTAALREAFVAVFTDDRVGEAAPQLGSEDFGLLPEGAGTAGVYWLLGGMSDEVMARPDVPSNHSPRFAPVLEPTIRTGVLAAVTAMRSSLAPPAAEVARGEA